MYTVLIVDDEFIERDGLRFLLSQIGGLTLLDAKSGEEALSVLAREAVDILITDIRMPGLSGLDLLSEARKLTPGLVVMIHSAYGEFEYAQRAIRENITAYVLKPIDPDRFRKEFDRCVKAVEEVRLRRETQWMERMFWHGNLSAPALEPECLRTLLLIRFPEPIFRNRTDEFARVADRLSGGWWLLDDDRAMLALSAVKPASEPELIATGRHVLEHMESALAVTPAVFVAQPPPGDAPGPAMEAMDRQCELRLFRPGSVTILNERMRFSDQELYEQLEQINNNVRKFVVVKDAESALSELEQLALLLDSLSDMSALYTRFAVTEIMKQASCLLESTAEDHFTLIESIWSVTDTHALLNFVKANIERMTQILSDAGNLPQNGHAVIKRILGIVHSQYGEDLTLEGIAQSVYMTPTYVSHLFKRYTGQTLIRYMNRYRLRRAADMLLSGDLRITDIMLQVGYKNSSYFGAIFRSQYGVTPSQYRKQKGAASLDELGNRPNTE